MKIIVSAFIVCDKKVLLIRHVKKDMWLPVGGHHEEGEDLYEAILRECKEEIGISPEIISLGEQFTDEKQSMPLPFNILSTPEKIIVEFIAKTNSFDVKLQEEEIADYKWLSEEDLLNNVVETILPVKKKALFALNFIK